MNDKKQEKKHVLRFGIIIGSICVLAGAFIFEFTDISDILLHPKAMRLSEIPMEKLNQGYDLVCKDRDGMSLCLFNNTKNTQINYDGLLVLQDPKSNKTALKIHTFEIKGIDGYCIKEFHIDYKNQTTFCTDWRAFPTDVWSISKVNGMNIFDSIYSLRNGTGT